MVNFARQANPLQTIRLFNCAKMDFCWTGSAILIVTTEEGRRELNRSDSTTLQFGSKQLRNILRTSYPIGPRYTRKTHYNSNRAADHLLTFEAADILIAKLSPVKQLKLSLI